MKRLKPVEPVNAPEEVTEEELSDSNETKEGSDLETNEGSNTEEFDPSESEDEAQQLREIEELERIEGKGFVVEDEDEEETFSDDDYQPEQEFEDSNSEEEEGYEKEVHYKPMKQSGLVKKVIKGMDSDFPIPITSNSIKQLNIYIQKNAP